MLLQDFGQLWEGWVCVGGGLWVGMCECIIAISKDKVVISILPGIACGNICSHINKVG